MIDVSQAESLIFVHSPLMGITQSALENTHAEILRQNIIADRDLPPFDRVAMDGIAIRFEAWQNGQRTFKIQSTQRAGEAPHTLQESTACIEIMTGAVLPIGSDCVIKVEDLILEGQLATLSADARLKPGQNIHRQGSDAKQGQILLSEGSPLGPLQWALAAAVGQTRLDVSQKPKCALISTGDEIVPADQLPLAHQIRGSNAWMMAAALKKSGFDAVSRHHFLDDQNELETGLFNVLNSHDVLILTGGVSMGKYDFIPEILQSLGVREVFYKIEQRPGKPMWFGIGPRGQRVFGLPGNPASASVCLFRYVLPSLFKSIGIEPVRQVATLAHAIQPLAKFTYFVPVTLTPSGARILAEQVMTQGSGDFHAIAHSQGFIELPPAQHSWPAGTEVALWRW